MTATGVYRFGAIVFAGFTLLGIYFLVRLPWAAKVDFDIIGFLWLLENLPKLAVAAGTVFAGAVALYCWVRSRA